MIIELLFKLVLGLIGLFLDMIPTIDFSLKLPDTTFFRQLLGAVDYVFPLDTFVLAIGIYFTIQNSQFILKIFNFIYKKIPFLG